MSAVEELKVQKPAQASEHVARKEKRVIRVYVDIPGGIGVGSD